MRDRAFVFPLPGLLRRLVEGDPTQPIPWREAMMLRQSHTQADLAQRVDEIRHELYGAHVGPLLAEALRLPDRTWRNDEAGVTIPAFVILRFTSPR
jgi:hypothetical protein